MERLEVSPDAAGGMADSQELELQSIDIERLFVETDEITVMKTLQNMHLANYQLENEIKGVMTEELEPIMLYSGTMLKMCSLVRQAQTGLNDLAQHCRNFDIEPVAVTPDVDNGHDADTELIEFMSRCADLRGNDSSIDSLLQNTTSIDHVTLLLKSMHILQRISMDNLRLLKRGKLLRSYQLLKVSSPALITLVAHLKERLDISAQLTNTQSVPGHTGDFLADVISGRQHLLERISPEDFQEAMRELPGVIRYNLSKLLRNCESAFGSSKLMLLMEASLCLLMDDERYSRDTDRLWRKRTKAVRVESSRLMLGSLSSCEELVSQLLTSSLYRIFCLNINSGVIPRLKTFVGIHAQNLDSLHEPVLSNQNYSFYEQKYWQESVELLSRNLERVELEDMVEFNARLKESVIDLRKSLEDNELLTQLFAAVGLNLKTAVVKASGAILDQIDTTYADSVQGVAMNVVTVIERHMNARNICTTQIKALSSFVTKAHGGIVSAVNERLRQILKSVHESVQELGPPEASGGILDRYSEEGSVSQWLHTTGLGNLVLNTEALWTQLEAETSALVAEIATKSVLPSEGNDRVVLTLIGTAALGSQYALQGARTFSNHLKKAVLEYWLSRSGELDNRDKSLLILCFRESGGVQTHGAQTDKWNELAAELGEDCIESHRSEYETWCNLV
ncbi:hypothetical protein BaOVIS_028940 [Babesia ovis]|uniref:Uncharacterized protein n=1 Tax=Babesia ovis TaxID=5869 RepID=A0A9W5TDD3_BABOV|nr:hypothetical protein BaOVIS_028940 [Babesia ovis]